MSSETCVPTIISKKRRINLPPSQLSSLEWTKETTPISCCDSTNRLTPTDIEDLEEFFPVIGTNAPPAETTLLEYSSTSPAKFLQDTKAYHRVDECLEKDFPADLTMGRKRKSLGAQLIEFIWEKKITSTNQWNAMPYEDKMPFLSMPNIASCLSQAIGALCQEYLQRELFIDTSGIPLGNFILWSSQRSPPKIVRLLKHQGYSEKRMTFFASILKVVLNRKSKKRGCIWIHGVSNGGKTQLCQSLMDIYFTGIYGVPSNYSRTQFQFGNCLQKRCIFWEEPVINEDNLETVKNLFAGGKAAVDVKFKDNITIDPTPFVVTSNKHPSYGVYGENREAVLNRIYSFNFPVKCGDELGDELFPLVKQDWEAFYGYIQAQPREEPVCLDCPNSGV